MSKYSSTIEYKISTALDKSGIAQLQAEIIKTEAELQKLANFNLISDKSAKDAQQKLASLRDALNKSFNGRLGMLDISAFGKELKKANTSITDLQTAFSSAGTTGQRTFNSFLGQIGKIDTGIKSVSRTTEKMFNTIGNTVRWGIVASGFQQILNSVHQTVQYVRDLDESLTNIMMVTGQSREQMNAYAQTANEVAKALSSTTVAMTDATLVFAQQGFDTETSTQLARRSTQLANISQQDTSVTSDQITTMMNAYNFSGDLDQIDAAMDSWAQVANDSAADVEEIATASQKAASTAYTVGLTMDQLNAQIATIESVTREAPENIGNALKTIYSRFADIKLGETLDDGVDLGQIAKTLGKVGVDVLDDSGQMRGVGDIMEQLMEVWDTMSQTDQSAISTVIAGRYQLSRFQALMNRSDLYEDYLYSSENATGTADQMQEIYANSLEGNLNQLQATAEGIFNDIFNTDDFYGMIEALTQLLNLTNDWINALGGAGPVLTGLGSIFTRVFSDNISAGLSNFISNRNLAQQQEQNKNQTSNLLTRSGLDATSERNKELLEYMTDSLNRAGNMTQQQQEQYNEDVEATITLKNKQLQQEEQILAAVMATNAAYRAYDGQDEDDLISYTRDEKGNLRLDTSRYDRMVAAGQTKSGKEFGSVEDLQNSFTEKVSTEYANKVRQGAAILSTNVNALVRYAKTMDSTSESAEALGVAIRGVDRGQALLEKSLKGNISVAKEATEAYDNFIKAVNGFKDGSISFDQLQAAAAKLEGQIANTTKAIDKMNNASITSNDAMRSKAGEYQTTGAAVAAQESLNAAHGEVLGQQSDINNIIDATAAVGQLAFAWQSFQSLGSIWVNADLDGGEKISQIIMNLSMTLPMLLSGFGQLNEVATKGKKSFDNVAESIADFAGAKLQAASDGITAINAGFNESSKAGRKAVAANGATAISMGVVGTAAKGASVAVSGLGKALAFLGSGSGMAIIAGLTILSTVFSTASAAAEQAYADSKAQAEDAISEYDTLSSSVGDFNKLYEEYKSTGEASQEFISSAQQLSDTLGIQGGNALIAANNFETLANKISEADAAQREAASRDIEAFLSGSNAASIEGNFLGIGNGSAYNDLQVAAGSNTDLAMGIEQAKKEGSISKAIGVVNEEINSYNDQIDDLEKQISQKAAAGQDTSNLETLRDGLLSRIDRLNNVLSQEDLQDWQDKQSQLAAYNAQNLNLENLDYQEIVNEFFDSENGMSEYLESLGSWSDQLSWMIQNTTDEAAKLKLELQQAYGTGGDTLYNIGKSTAESGMLTTYDAEGNATTESSEDIGNAYSQSVLGRLKDMGLSEDQQINFIAGIDETTSIQQIEQQLQEIANDPTVLSALEFQPKFTNRLDNSDEAISEVLEESGVSENAFNRMSYDMYSDESGYFQTRESELQDALSNINESNFQDYVKDAEDAEEATDRLKAELGDLGAEAKDTATANIRLNKGVEDLTDTWEDYGSILTDEASQGTSDWYEAVGELDEAMSDILNIDVGTLSNDFYKNADAIDAMGRAAAGDMTAIDDLRRIANEDIIMNMEVSNISPEDLAVLREQLLSESQALQAEINSMPLEMKMTTNFDDSEYVQHLNQLIADSQITAEQATAALSSIGMSATIDYKEMDVTVPEYTYHMEGSLAGLLSGDENAQTDVKVSTYQSGTKTFTGLVPQLIGSHYTGSGVTSVGGGSRGGSGGGGGGGSKGGGSGKSYEPKKKDPIEEEIDRYERVNTLLEDAENRYDRLNSDRERLTGFDMADDMEEEIKLLNRQIELHKEKLEIQKEEAQELRDELSREYGITFDQEGFITNYATTHQRLIDEVNRLIDQYNATTSESGQEALEEQIEDAQDALDKFNETYQRYDELWAGDLQETLNTLEDIEDQIEDIRIEAFNTQVKAADNLQDIQETLNEFNNTLSHFGEDTGLRDAELAVENLKMGFDIANESAEQLYDTLIARGKERLQSGLLTDEQRRAIEQDIQMYENAKKQIGAGSIEAGGTGMLDMSMNNMRIILEQIRQYENTGTSTIFGEASSELYDAAQDVFDQATDDIQDLEGWVNDLRDAILDMIDEVAEAIEERQEQYEAITDELEHQRDIIELIHGDEAYTQINEVLAAQQNNYQTSIKEMTQTLDYWKDLLGSMEEGSEEWKAINEQIVETQEALNDLVQKSLENLQEQYENTVNNITNQWVESALGTDLDWMSEQWELINRNADYYLDDVNAAYETQKLQNKYFELLDGSNDLHIQQMITEQMKQQLGYLRDKEKISEYDVAYANAQLEILQKRIALEEAQRNKSQMQLRRDSQGNYRYVYTADEGDVNAAEGDLLDAQNNAYNLSKEQMKQTQDDSLSALQDAQQLLNDIWTNANLSLEEKKNRTQTIIDSLKEYLAGTSEQLGESEKNIINDFIGMVEIMTDENNERLQDVYEQIINGNLDAFDQIDTRWSTSLTEWLQHMEDFNISTDGMFENLIDNANDYQEEIDAVGDLVETDFNDMSDSIQNTIDKTNELASSTSDFINQLKNDAGTIKEYEGTLQSYADKISDVTNEMKAYKDQVTELGQQLEAKEQENANLTSQIENLQNENEQLKAQQSGGSGGGGGSFGGSGYSESDLAWGIAQNIWTYGISGGWGNDPTRSGKLTGAYGSSFARKVQDIINKNAWSGNLVNYDSSKFSSYSLLGYDTGGYTGEWSDKTNDAKNGKLAYLHQKELVLNAADTENILKAVDIVRQMTQALKSSAISGTISDMVNGKFKMTDNNEKIEQEVHITAEFPNANSASEIEAALLSLNERAVQYSFRRN